MRSKRGTDEGSNGNRKKFRKHVILKGVAIWVTGVITGASIAAAAGGVMYYDYLMGSINRKLNVDMVLYDLTKQPEPEEYAAEEDVDDTTGLEEASRELNWKDLGYNIKQVDGVVNVLLCGEEAMEEHNAGSTERGRADCVMIATINTNQKTLKLTSLMRDSYVEIPGYSSNKLNASYRFGGIPLLMKTVENNFGIKMDGYVKIEFDGFENMINLLGGVEVDITKEESEYLNSSPYISNPKYRTTKPGKNVFNGNQALGYSRVRYVKTGNGLADDYGRNYRQRIILQGIFDKYRKSKPAKIVKLLPKVMELIETDLSDKEIISYAANVIKFNVKEIEQYRVPIEGYYKNAKVGQMAVLYITDINGIRNKLHEYIYGEPMPEEKPEEQGSTEQEEDGEASVENSGSTQTEAGMEDGTKKHVESKDNGSTGVKIINDGAEPGTTGEITGVREIGKEKGKKNGKKSVTEVTGGDEESEGSGSDEESSEGSGSEDFVSVLGGEQTQTDGGAGEETGESEQSEDSDEESSE